MSFTIQFGSDPVSATSWLSRLGQVTNTESSFSHLQTGDGNICVTVRLWGADVVTPSVHSECSVNINCLSSSFLSVPNSPKSISNCKYKTLCQRTAPIPGYSLGERSSYLIPIQEGHKPELTHCLLPSEPYGCKKMLLILFCLFRKRY